MKILYLCNEYPPYPHGGIGTFVQTLAQQLVKRGHVVTVAGIYRIKEPQKENDNGVIVFRIPASFRWLIGPLINHHRLRKTINQIHTESPVDLIEGNELSFGLFFKRFPVKTIIRIQGGHLFFTHALKQKRRVLASIIEKKSFSKASFFCAVSHFAAETTRKLHNGLRGHSIEILPNPVNTDFFHPYPEVKEIENLIIFTGGLREKKGVVQLAQAMQKIVEKYPSAQLWLHGADTNDSRSKESVMEVIRNEVPPEILSHISFRGLVSHESLPKINALASVLAYPSWMETQGIVVIEGMASGKPVIASATGPGPELIDDGINGFLCDPFSPESIAEKVILLFDNEELRKEIAKEGRRKALAHFSVNVLVEKNIDFYEKCLEEN